MTVDSIITRLILLRFLIGLKISRQFINQSKGKSKPVATGTREFSRALSKLHRIATNLDWFIALFVSPLIGRSNYFGICFSTLNSVKTAL